MLQDSVVEDIAAEDESSRLERQRFEEKVAVWQTSLQKLHRLDRHHLTGNIVQSLYMERRLTVLTDVSNVDEQHSNRSSTELKDDGDIDTPNAHEQSPRSGKESLAIDDTVQAFDNRRRQMMLSEQ